MKRKQSHSSVPLVIVRDAHQLGAAIQRFRKDADWIQITLSEASGIKQPAVSAIEAGSNFSRLVTIFNLLAALDLEIVIRPRTKGKII